MPEETKLRQSPNSKEALTHSLANIVEQSSTIAEALSSLAKYIITLDPKLALRANMDIVRAKAYEAAEQRRLTIPFELRWRTGGGEIVQGWETLVKRLKHFELRYRVTTLKSMLSGGSETAFALTNPDTGLLDVFTVKRVELPKPKRGRPIGSAAPKKQTRATAIAALTNPHGNKMRGKI